MVGERFIPFSDIERIIVGANKRIVHGDESSLTIVARLAELIL